MGKTVLRVILVVVGTLGMLATLLPLAASDKWWIRIWDFPRAQVALLLLMAAIGTLLGLNLRRPFPATFLAVLGIAFGYQTWRIVPYTPLHAAEAVQSGTCAEPSRLNLLSANVLISNRRAEPLLSLVRRVQPDLILLLETDAWWDRHLHPLEADYPYVVCQPQADSYGMHLFSKLPLVGPQIRFLLEDYVPSIETGVELRSGAVIDFYGLHPKPPPLQDTERRNAELLIVARKVRRQAGPVVVAGDLNGVAWSQTNRRFQEISGLLDPRIGRGLYPTFNAQWPLLRWPLDHAFFEDSFTLVDMQMMVDIGSDHFPFHIVLCHRPRTAPQQAEPAPDRQDIRKAREAIREGREEN